MQTQLMGSVGLGGGSLVREDGKVLVGPESVGYRILDEALVFGGNTLTATDIAVAAGKADIGNKDKVKQISAEIVQGAVERIKTMLELNIDAMKTSKDVSSHL